MNDYSIIQFIALIVFIIMSIIVLRDLKTRTRKLFLIYLLGATVWSMSSFMVHVNYFPNQLLLWGSVLPVSGLWTVVAYYHFCCGFVQKSGGKWIVVGYVFVMLLTVMAVSGFIPESLVYIGGGKINIEYGYWVYVLAYGGAIFTLLSVYRLIHKYRFSNDPLNRNRIMYLLIGVSFMIVFSLPILVVRSSTFAWDHIGHLGNGVMILYAITKYQLFDLKVVIRKSLAYSIVAVWITAMYLFFLYTLQGVLQKWDTFASTGAIIVIAFIMAVVFNPMQVIIQKFIDKVFYGERYDYRRTVLNFSRSMSNVLDLEELAPAMLEPIAKATNASQATLLLPDEAGFTSQYAQRLQEEEPIVHTKVSKDSPIITWLLREQKPLTKDRIDIDPEFKSLWEIERQMLDAMQLEVFCPIISKNEMIGILTLSRKASGGFFTGDDLELIITLTTGAAMAIENARLYDSVKQRAHTDELTTLYNHRYFHERLDEEISRCSRFGEVFSLLFLDLDLFKAYNDIYGHLAGDEVLRDVGRYLIQSIRGIDMAFRYGGDEFTVILPQATLEDARKVGERIRRKIEVEMDSRGAPLTCSIGVASWPTDGVMRDEIIKAADSALYQAKKVGRDRTCSASDSKTAGVIEVGIKAEGEPGILSTIYALAATVDAKDAYTYGHSKKVAKYATDIAQALGYTPDRVATLRAAALLHDIGKIGVSDQLLVKTGPLSEEDWEPIRSHPRLGVAIIKHVESLSGCLPAILYHHEHYDGTGYPSGLRGENIPLDARILAVADTYDAMTSLRPYREQKFTHEEAIAELKRCVGTQFDPKIVDIFVNLNIKPEQEMAGSAKAAHAFLWNKVK